MKVLDCGFFLTLSVPFPSDPSPGSATSASKKPWEMPDSCNVFVLVRRHAAALHTMSLTDAGRAAAAAGAHSFGLSARSSFATVGVGDRLGDKFPSKIIASVSLMS